MTCKESVQASLQWVCTASPGQLLGPRGSPCSATLQLQPQTDAQQGLSCPMRGLSSGGGEAGPEPSVLRLFPPTAGWRLPPSLPTWPPICWKQVSLLGERGVSRTSWAGWLSQVGNTSLAASGHQVLSTSLLREARPPSCPSLSSVRSQGCSQALVHKIPSDQDRQAGGG